MKLYEIVEGIKTILHQEDWSEQTEAELDRLSIALEVKADNIASVIEEADSFAERCKKEEARIAAIRKSAEARSEWLRSYLFRAMKAADRTEIAHGLHSFKIRKNPPRPVPDDEGKTPAKFVTVVQTTKIDRVGLLKAMKDGEDVPGWHIESGERLEIK